MHGLPDPCGFAATTEAAASRTRRGPQLYLPRPWEQQLWMTVAGWLIEPVLKNGGHWESCQATLTSIETC